MTFVSLDSHFASFGLLLSFETDAILYILRVLKHDLVQHKNNTVQSIYYTKPMEDFHY